LKKLILSALGQLLTVMEAPSFGSKRVTLQPTPRPGSSASAVISWHMDRPTSRADGVTGRGLGLALQDDRPAFGRGGGAFGLQSEAACMRYVKVSVQHAFFLSVCYLVGYLWRSAISKEKI
jgi:hypothetical protein